MKKYLLHFRNKFPNKNVTKCFTDVLFQISYDGPPKNERHKSSRPTSHSSPASQRQRQSSNTPQREATVDTVAPHSSQTLSDSPDDESSGSDDEPQNKKVMIVTSASNSLHM